MVVGNKREKARLFTAGEAHPIALHLLLGEDVSPSYIFWEPDTVWTEVRHTYGVSVSRSNKSKIQAVRTVLRTSGAHSDWELFLKVIFGLAGLVPLFGVLQVPSPAQLVTGVAAMMTVLPEREFSAKTQKVMAATLLEGGVAYALGLPGNIQVEVNRQLGELVGRALQLRIASAIRSGRRPTFDGSNPLDAQIVKSLLLKDYVSKDKSTLLSQLSLVDGASLKGAQ